jgi:predicted Zn finger-like uncharacterized protein
MPNTIHCPSCSRELRVPDELIGKKVKCPACSTTFTASVAGAQAGAAAPAAGYEEQPAGAPRPAGTQGEYEEGAPEEDFDRPPGYDRARERAKGRVMLPAIFLMIAAILGILADGFQVVYAFTPAPPVDPKLPEFFREMQKGAHEPQAIVMGIVGVVYCAIIIFACVQMMGLRMWGFALAGTIMSMINLCNGCCCLGLPFGVWALIILLDQEVKGAFR